MNEGRHDLWIVFYISSWLKFTWRSRQLLKDVPSGTKALRPFGTSGLSTSGVLVISAILEGFMYPGVCRCLSNEGIRKCQVAG